VTKRRKQHASDDVREYLLSRKLREGDAIDPGQPGAGKFLHWSIVWADEDKSHRLYDIFHVSGATAMFRFHFTV